MNIEEALRVISHEHGGGGTELLVALERAMSLPGQNGSARVVVLVSDGFVSADNQAIDLVRRNLGKANLFAFGIGRSVNRHVMEGLARAGHAEPFIVADAAHAADTAARFRRYVDAPVATHLEVSFHGFEAFELDPPRLPDLFAERPIILFGKYDGRATGTINVTGRSGSGRFTKTLEVARFTPDARNAALRFLWARQRVTSLSDLQLLGGNGSRSRDITALGLKYGLMTEYTSFLAVDSAVRNPSGNSTGVTQPLPLPAGVENSAVGRMSGLGKGAGRGGGGASYGVASKGVMRVLGEVAPGPPGKALVTGGLDKETIGRVIRRQQTQVGRCYEKRLLVVPTLAGKLVWQFTIGADGKVAKVELVSSTMQDADTETCVKRVLERLVFPAPAGGGDVKVTYPFVFLPPAP